MAHVDADRNLLFGLLALQNNFIDRDALVDAFLAGSPTARSPGPGPSRSRRPCRRAGTCSWPAWSKSTSSSTATTPRRAWRRSARSARCARICRASPTPTCRPAWPTSPRHARTMTRIAPSPQAEFGRLDLRRQPVPHPPPSRQGRAGPGLRRPRRGARPRGRAQGDPGPPRRRPATAAPGSCRRPRSPAGWSIPGSCRSTAWATTPTAGRSTPCGSSRATASRTRSRRFHEADRRPEARSRRSGRSRLRELLRPVHRRLQRDGLCPQPGRAAPRPEAGQHHAGPVRRDAGGRLGAGQAGRSRPEEAAPATAVAHGGDRCGRRSGSGLGPTTLAGSARRAPRPT